MSDAKKKPHTDRRVNNGGVRENCGRKPTGRINRRVMLSLPPDVADWVAANGKSRAVVRLVRAEMERLKKLLRLGKAIPIREG